MASGTLSILIAAVPARLRTFYCPLFPPPPIQSAYGSNTKWAGHLFVDTRDRTYWGASYLSVWFGRQYIAVNQPKRMRIVLQQRAGFSMTNKFDDLQQQCPPIERVLSFGATKIR